MSPSTCIREWFVCGWHMTVLFVCLLFFVFFLNRPGNCMIFACAALVLFWSRLHRRTHTSEWERSVWSKVSLNFTKTVWLESLTACLTDRAHALRSLTLTTLFVPSWAERWETYVCVDHVYQCWFYCWVLLNHIVYQGWNWHSHACLLFLMLLFDCFLAYFISFLSTWLFVLRNCGFIFSLFCPLAERMDGERWVGWMDEHSCTLSNYLSLFYIVGLYLCTPFFFFFFFWISASLGNVWMP